MKTFFSMPEKIFLGSIRGLFYQATNCAKSLIETLETGVKYGQSQQKTTGRRQ